MKTSQDLEQEIKLVKLIKLGDREALDRLLDIYIPQLKAFFSYIKVPEDYIDDLIQETFERMLNKIDSFDEKRKFSTWIMTIGRNIYVDQYRRKIKGEELLLAQDIERESFSDPEKKTVDKLTVEEMLKNLSDKEKFILEMRVFQKMPFAEIAEITEEEEATLRSRFFRVISRLKNTI